MENIKKLKEIKEILHKRNEYWWKVERTDLDLKYYVPTDVICDSLADYERGLTEEEYNTIYGEEHKEDKYWFNSYDEFNYFEDLEGAEYLGGDNTYNHTGNVQNDFQWHTFKLKDDVYIVLIAFHIGGDIRGNYTDYAVLEFDYEVGFEEFMISDISYENGLCFDLDVDGENYEITPLAFDECVEVYNGDTDDYVYGVWGNTDEDVKDMIRRKVIEEYMIDNKIISRQNSFLSIESFLNIDETRKNYELWKSILEKTNEYIIKDKNISEEKKAIYSKHVQELLIAIRNELELAEKR